MPSIHGTNWSFTLNFDSEIPILSFTEDVQYAIWQHEKVTHDHLQGFIQMVNSNSTLAKMKSIIPGAHFAKVTVNKTGRKPWEYASKEESRVAGPWEYGFRIEKGSNKRSKLEACERSPERMSIEETDLFRMYNSVKKQKAFIEGFSPPAWTREWQCQVNDLIKMKPNSREIIWVYGGVGGEGKTTFAKGLVQRGWAYIDPNKYADMFEMYHQQGTEKNVVCDFHRSCEVDAFYGFLEKIKNRVIPKIKYRSMVHIELNDIHIVVMANVLPNYDKISKDRMVLIEAGFTESSLHKKKKSNMSDIPDNNPSVSEKLGSIIYMGIRVDMDNIIRELPSGNWVCYEDEEFEYIVVHGSVTSHPESGRDRVTPTVRRIAKPSIINS